MSDNPNPQGKGQVPVLATLMEGRAAGATVPPKQIDRVSTELFTSLFVLESDFRFKPVVGKSYWLYCKNGRFWLSVIAPEALGSTVGGRFIGQCVLQPDATWTLELADEVAVDTAFQEYLCERRCTFEERLEAAQTMEDVLPTHEGRLPFYQRAFAFALAGSLSRSMDQSGILGLSYQQAQGRLAADPDGAEVE